MFFSKSYYLIVEKKESLFFIFLHSLVILLKEATRRLMLSLKGNPSAKPFLKKTKITVRKEIWLENNWGIEIYDKENK